MKTAFSYCLIFCVSVSFALAQSESGWSVPKNEIIFRNEQGEVAKMWVDQGLRYADVEYQGRTFRVFYHRNNNNFNKARIVDNDSQVEIARGRGGLNGLGKFVFENGEEVKLIKKRSPNGYEIIGPYGTLFKVENHGISPAKTYQQSDFLAQAFFVFDRIKHTQTPPSEVLMIMVASN